MMAIEGGDDNDDEEEDDIADATVGHHRAKVITAGIQSDPYRSHSSSGVICKTSQLFLHI